MQLLNLVRIKLSKNYAKPKSYTRHIWLYDTADYDDFRKELMEVDWDECFSKLNSMVGDDGDIVSLDDPSNKDKAQDFLKYFLKFGKMRQRKVKKELESYTIANNSSFLITTYLLII